MKKPEASIIIPAYNEEKNIAGIIGKLKALYPAFEILVVNDGSKDRTAQVAKESGAVVYSHPHNIGNGAAIKTGIRKAKGDILVFMDGDGQHNPEDIAEFLKCFPDYDMVVGARRQSDQATPVRALGNRIFNRLASYVAKFSVQDLTSGFRAIKADIARQFLYLLPNTYSYPTTLTLCVLRSGLSLKYVPIRAHVRQSGKSRINTFRDGVRFFMIIIKICSLYSPFRIFLPVSCATFMLGLLYYFYTFITVRRFTNMTALLFTTSIIIFMMGLVSEQICNLHFQRAEYFSHSSSEESK